MNEAEREVAKIIRHHLSQMQPDAIDANKLAKDIIRQQAISMAARVLNLGDEPPPAEPVPAFSTYCQCDVPKVYESQFGKACAKCGRFYIR